MEGATYYYYDIPKNPVNDWLVAEHQKRFNAPPDFFTAGGFAAAMAVVDGGQEGEVDRHREADRRDGRHELRHAQGQDDLPQGRPSGAAGMYHFKIKVDPDVAWGVPELVREIKPEEMNVPIRNKR